MDNIGQRIREIRESKGMTQEQLAHLVGYKSRVSINKIELKRDLPFNKLVPIARALEVEPDYLIGWSDNKEPIIAEIGTRNEHLFGKRVISYAKKLMCLNDEDKEVIFKMIDQFYKYGGDEEKFNSIDL